MARFLNTSRWFLPLAVAIVAGKLLGKIGLPEFAPVPLLAVLSLYVVAFKDARLLTALLSGLFILLLARSVLAPGILPTTAPVWVSGLMLLALVLQRKVLKVPPFVFFVILLSLALVLPTLFQGSAVNSMKSIGIGATWLLVFVGTANLAAEDRLRLQLMLILSGVFEALLSIAESVGRSEFVRTFVTGSAADGTYILRPNLILGGWVNRAQGTIGYPIPFAFFIVLGLLFALFGSAIESKKLRVSAALLLFFALLLSGARSSFVGLAAGVAVGITVLWWRAHREHRHVPGLKWMLTAMIALAAAGIAFLIRSVQTDDYSLTHRGGVVESAVNVLGLPLSRVIFGSGYNSSEALFRAGILRGTGLAVVDNTFLTQLVFSGLLGLTVLCAILVVAFVNSDLVGKAGLAAIVSSFFFYDVFNWHLSTYMLFLFVGFAAAGSRPVRPLDFVKRHTPAMFRAQPTSSRAPGKPTQAGVDPAAGETMG